MNSYRFYTCKPAEKPQIAKLLMTVKKDLGLPNINAADEVTDFLFNKGGIMGGYHHQKLCGILGYLTEEPGQPAQQRDGVVFLYVGAIQPEYQLSRLFYYGLLHVLKQFEQMGFHTIRLQASQSNPYTNRLYGRFATAVSQGNSRRGQPVITYEAPISDALQRLTPSPCS